MDRMRRLRRTENIRKMVRESHVRIDELIYPLFIIEGEDICRPVESMPGIFQYSVDRLDEELERIDKAGISSVLLFGIPACKDETGTGAYDENGVVQQAIRHIRAKYPDMVIIADVCLCEYTSHGHCGILSGGEVDNDLTLPLLAKIAVSYARAGVDMVAPSGMMDHMVESIRTGLDKEGFLNIPVVSYSAKFASGYYGPFRDAAQSAPQFGDRRSYQMDPANGREALREIEQDLREGADMVIAKPAMAYLDVIKESSMRFNVPVIAYNVSGEYAMVKAAAAKGWIDEKRIVMENLTGMKRAGAKMIITYHALDAAGWIREDGI
ncbi:MAG: porphobilinogen synthase [Dorea sp.]|nr:porphobilinogen synthase [Dorea sp.]